MKRKAGRFHVSENVIIRRIIGEPTETQLHECRDELLSLVKQSGSKRVLYDARRINAPTVDVVLAQRSINEALRALDLRQAIVVASTRAGYLAGLAFGPSNFRVFYSDTEAALAWLAQP
jgi:hypothetical protein